MKISSSDEISKIPFSVSRANRGTLVEQVAAGLRRCIRSGIYKSGDVLPSTRNLAEALGVSRIVTRSATRVLAREGLINPKPSRGSVVLGNGGKLWNGNVLFVTRSLGTTYYVNAFIAELRSRLVREGWLFTQVTAMPDLDGRADVAGLEEYLSHPVSLAVVMFDNPDAVRTLSRAGVPYVTLGDGHRGDGNLCRGHVRYDRRGCSAEFAAWCAENGIRRVMQIGETRFNDVGDALAEAGIDVSEWVIGREKSGLRPGEVALRARDVFAARLAESTRFPADLLYFNDDYVCAGALAAMQRFGVDIPDGLKVASWVNRGNPPVTALPFSRLEIDPVENAASVSGLLSDVLSGREVNGEMIVRPKFHPGGEI